MSELQEKLKAIKVGDVVTRMISGILPMEIIVSEVTEDRIICGGWVFNRVNGAEIDEDLGLDGETVTASILKV